MLGDFECKDLLSVCLSYIKGRQEVSFSNNVLLASGLCEALGGESRFLMAAEHPDPLVFFSCPPLCPIKCSSLHSLFDSTLMNGVSCCSQVGSYTPQ